MEMLAGTRPPEWGAWVAACLEFLSGAGYVTHSPEYGLTEKGREFLKNRV